jgi:hypothetical protein
MEGRCYAIFVVTTSCCSNICYVVCYIVRSFYICYRLLFVNHYVTRYVKFEFIIDPNHITFSCSIISGGQNENEKDVEGDGVDEGFKIPNVNRGREKRKWSAVHLFTYSFI